MWQRDKTVCLLCGEFLFNTSSKRNLKLKRWEDIHHDNSNLIKLGVPIKIRHICSHMKKTVIIVKWAVMVFLNDYAPANTASYHIKQKLAQLKGRKRGIKIHNYTW